MSVVTPPLTMNLGSAETFTSGLHPRVGNALEKLLEATLQDCAELIQSPYVRLRKSQSCATRAAKWSASAATVVPCWTESNVLTRAALSNIVAANFSH